MLKTLQVCTFGTLLVCSTTFSFSCSSAKCEDSQVETSNQPKDAVRDLGDIVLEPSASAWISVPLPDGKTWNIGIHLLGDSSNSKKAFDAIIEPIFVLKTFSTFGSTKPSFVKKITNSDKGAVRVDVDFILGSRELDILAKRELFKAQPKKMVEFGYENYNQISIGKWSLLHTVMQCFVGGPSGELIGEASSGTMTKNGDEVELQFYLSPLEYSKMVSAHAANDLYFVPRYSSKASRVEEVKIEQTADIDQNQISELIVKSEKERGSNPIYQWDKDKLVIDLKGNFRTFITTTREDLLTKFTPSTKLAERMFESISVHTAEYLRKPGNEQLLGRIHEVLKPLQKNIEEATGRKIYNFSLSDGLEGENSKSGTRNTDETTSTIGGGVAASGNIGVLKVGGVVNGSRTFGRGHEEYVDEGKFKQELDSIEASTGITFTKGNSSSEWVAHEIKVFTYTDAKTSMKLVDILELCVKLGAENRYLEDSPVPAGFTDEVLDDFILDSFSTR